jgi:general secretion pathway protein C
MGFDAALKRYFPGVILALLALAAYFHASAIGQLVGEKLGADEKTLAALPPASPRSPGAGPLDDHQTSARSIFDRNPFDSTTPRPLDAPAASATAAGPEEPLDLEHSENAPLCDGFKVLIVVASDADPTWSMAALSGGGQNTTKLVRVGEEIGGKKVELVEWRRVVLSGGGSLCQVQMFKPSKAPAGASAAAPVAPPPPAPVAHAGGPGSLPQDIASKIQKVSATEFNVDRQVVDKILENQAELMKSARIVPEQENGKVVGIRLFGVRPDTLLGVLGLENGDRLQGINGFDMTSPEAALQAYARLRSADHLTVQVNRRGQNLNLDFNIK